MKLNTIYTTFQGEVNRFGIGSPSIFVRLQGCHLRCYKKSLGELCDTPEALRKPTEKDEFDRIFAQIEKTAQETGIKIITLTGGDPLWNEEADLVEFFTKLTDAGYYISVETSGTISWLPYTQISSNISWVLDYKLPSTGVKANICSKYFDSLHLRMLNKKDFIKFVVYDEADMEQTIKVVRVISETTNAKLAVGAYWGGKLSALDIFNRLKDEKLLDKTVMNFQVHKLIIDPNFKATIPVEI